MLRQAVGDGGLDFRISQQPFIYLDKNYVRILGGVANATKIAVRPGHRVIVQVRGEAGPMDEESVAAAYAGAEIVMIDTGRREDIPLVSDALRSRGLRSKVQIAFSGNILLDDIEGICRMDVDILDIGYAILDAPCLPMHFDVIGVAGQDAVKRDLNKEGSREI
jgi:nicotinate-nucleotide pyrophosphorylase (carboxylating)